MIIEIIMFLAPDSPDFTLFPFSKCIRFDCLLIGFEVSGSNFQTYHKILAICN